MAKKIIITIIAIIAILAVVVAIQPSEFRVSRSTIISAPADIIFPHVNDLHKNHEWSPWAKLDPEAKNTYKGPDAGPGAIIIWEGNMKVGQGSMTITESRLNEFVKLKLDFLKPIQATNTAEFTIKEENNGTAVTWSMYGEKDFIGKALGLVFNCEKKVGEQFDKGLENLKEITEAEANQ